jgi:hypothetical protein
MSTKEGGRLSCRRTLDERKADARIVSVRSHSRLNLNDSARDGSASGARKARSAVRSTLTPSRR